MAILISEGLNVIDFSGPWGVFESVSVPNATEAPFQLFTVSEKAGIVISGSGLKLMPRLHVRQRARNESGGDTRAAKARTR